MGHLGDNPRGGKCRETVFWPGETAARGSRAIENSAAAEARLTSSRADRTRIPAPVGRGGRHRSVVRRDRGPCSPPPNAGDRAPEQSSAAWMTRRCGPESVVRDEKIMAAFLTVGSQNRKPRCRIRGRHAAPARRRTRYAHPPSRRGTGQGRSRDGSVPPGRAVCRRGGAGGRVRAYAHCWS